MKITSDKWQNTGPTQFWVACISFVIGFFYAGYIPSGTFGTVMIYGIGGALLGLASLHALALVPARYRVPMIVGVGALAFVLYLITPHNYSDCVLTGMKDAKNEEAAQLIRRACQDKFGRGP